MPAKRLDIAIEACNRLQLPFTIIGKGPELENLRKLAGSTISLTGYLPDEERDALIQNADLFLFPSFEDFGVAPVEALAAGVPLVAYKAGGALDYVNHGSNGLLFSEQTPESLVVALRAASGMTFENTSESAEKFDVSYFRTAVRNFVGTIVAEHKRKDAV